LPLSFILRDDTIHRDLFKIVVGVKRKQGKHDLNNEINFQIRTGVKGLFSLILTIEMEVFYSNFVTNTGRE
jgi:hypothetical protein